MFILPQGAPGTELSSQKNPAVEFQHLDDQSRIFWTKKTPQKGRTTPRIPIHFHPFSPKELTEERIIGPWQPSVWVEISEIAACDSFETFE